MADAPPGTAIKELNQHETLQRMDPFAAYMSWRPRSDKSKDWGSGTIGAGKLVTKLPVSYFGKLPKPEEDPFACYLTLRPPKQRTAPEAEQELREELLRAKRMLLETAVKAEEKAMDDFCPENARASLKQLKYARLYLQDPRLADKWRFEEEHAAEEKERERQLAEEKKRATSGRWKMATFTSPRESDGSQSPGAQGGAARSLSRAHTTNLTSALKRTEGLGESQSAPNLRKGAPQVTIDPNAPATKRIPTGTTPMSKRISNASDEPVLQGWFTATRLWNLSVTRNSQTARRHNLEFAGGAVVLGNGRMPLYSGRHLMSPGYYYNFLIGEVDDLHFPVNKVRDLSFAFGVSRLPGHDRACERPTYGYEIPGTVIVGYGARLIDQGRWYETSWDPKVLEPGDEVGVLIGMEGDLAVFVNGQQVMRVKTSLCDDAREILKSPSSKSKKRALFPIVDLHGRVCNVKIGMRKAPPNVPLEAIKRLNLAPLLKTPPPPPPPPTP